MNRVLLCLFSILPVLLFAAGKKAPLSYLVILQRPEMAYRDHAALAPSRELRAEIAKRGIIGGMLPLDKRITLEELKKYNFVVVGIDQSDFKLSLTKEEATGLGKLLAEYVRQGGGLYLTRNGGYQFGQDIVALNHILEPFGAMVPDEQLIDEKNSFNAPSTSCYWTGNIVPGHPVTEGVKGLFIPEVHGTYKTYTDFASPVKVDSNWTVLAKMEVTGKSYHRLKNGKKGNPQQPGSFDSEAPFLAVRNFGKGRVVLFPVSAPMYWQETHHPFFGDGKFMEGNSTGKPADGIRLVGNIMSYLAEPSKDTFGGFNKPYNFKAAPPPVLGAVGRDWSKVEFRKSVDKLYTGLIGAQSNLTCGKGSPQEFIDAAKAAGYNFIAFAEDFAKLDEAKFNELKSICAKAAAPGFRAYPGIRYTDETGCQWLVFSDRITYPPKAWHSTRFPGRIVNNNPVSRGWNWAPVIILKSNLNPQEPWFKGNYKIIATHTYENGKLVDDSTANYLRLNNDRFLLSPVAVHLITSPEEVASARKNGMQSMVRWPDDDVVKAYTGRYCDYKGGYRWFRPTFVSSGPEIRNFTIANFGTSDLAIKGNDRIRIYFNVHAPAGIKEIIVHDGDKKAPFRRFLPGGKTDFEVSFDSFHMDRRALILEITDMNGGKCFSQEAWTSIAESEFARCTDNINTMPRGKWWGTPDGKHNMRGLEDYMVGRDFRYFGIPIFHTIGGEGSHPRVEYRKVLSSRHCLIVDCHISKHFPDKESNNHDTNDAPLELRKNRFYSGVVRHILFTGRQDSSMVVFVEGDLDVLRSFVDRPKVATIFLRKDAKNLTYTQLNGQLADLDMSKTPKPFNIKMPRTGFAALHPHGYNGAPGIFALSNNLTSIIRTPAGPRHFSLNAFIGDKGITSFRKGDKIQYRYIAVIGAFNPNPGAKFMTDLRDGLGIGRKPAYTVESVIGQAVPVDGILRITPDNGSFRGKTSGAELPIDLPVIISGLNPNWDTGIVYYGKNRIKTQMYASNEYLQRSVFIRDVEHDNLLQHIPVLDNGDGYLQIETSSPRDLFIGNLLICGDKNLCLSVVNTLPGERAFEAHNPTDKVIRTVVRPAKGFTLLGEFSREIEVAPGTSVTVKLP